MRYDVDRIIEDSDSYEVAQAIGIECVRKGKNVFIPCPGHLMRKGRIDTHIGNARLTRNGYYCESCGKAVSTVGMVMEVKNIGYREAIEFVGDLNGGKEMYETHDSEWEKYNHEYQYKTNKKAQKTKKKLPLIGWKNQKEIALEPDYDKSFYPIFCYLSKPKETAQKHGRLNADGDVDYEWLVVDKTKRISIATLYQEDYEAYLYLVASKSGEMLTRINDVLAYFKNSQTDFCANMVYVLTQKRDVCTEILMQHIEALVELQMEKEEKRVLLKVS